MAGATGTAAQMKTRLLDNFTGEKKGLIGSVQTFLQLVGEPFRQVFAGILSVLRRAFVAVNQFIAAIPTPVKIFLAKVVLVVGSVVALIGAARRSPRSPSRHAPRCPGARSTALA